MTMKELKQSETRVIKRSQINLNPINPKRHSDERIKLKKKNLQKVGFLGGIVMECLLGLIGLRFIWERFITLVSLCFSSFMVIFK